MSTWAATAIGGGCHGRGGPTPFPVGAPSAASPYGRSREEAISEFEALILHDGLLVRDLLLLRGKILVCHCWLDGACHADVLVSACRPPTRDARRLAKAAAIGSPVTSDCNSNGVSSSSSSGLRAEVGLGLSGEGDGQSKGMWANSYVGVSAMIRSFPGGSLSVSWNGVLSNVSRAR
jgi:hypothetical protein